MDLGRVMEGPGRRSPLAAQRDVAIRDSAPPQTTRTIEESRPSSMTSNVPAALHPSSSSDVWSGAISRLQTQVLYNTSMLESNRRQVADIEQAVGRLQQEMGNVVAVINEMQTELRSGPAGLAGPRHDTGDLDVLAGQIAAVTTKANEVDGLRMQLDLMKNRLKRVEEQGSSTAPGQRPGTSSTTRELYEVTPAASQQHVPPHQPLPPMRTGSMVSQYGERSYGMPAPPVLPSQGTPSFHPPTESRTLSSEHSSMHSPSAAGLRPGEPLPPPSTISGWRPAEGHPQHPPSVAPPPPSHQGQFRPHMMEPQPQTSGWAAVNVNHPVKRTYEDHRQSPYEASSAPGSPKRPRLAPIMPRSSYGDDSYVPTPSSMQQTATTATSEGTFHPRSRAPSDGSQSQSQSLPTPASANTNSYRFITSTAQADSQDSWRPEAERIAPAPLDTTGRGRGRGARARGGRGRGGRGGAHALDVQELGTPEWERPDWTGSQVSPNGYYNPLQPARGGLARRSGGAAGAPSDRPYDYPSTPITAQQDALDAGQADGVQHSSGKKSRTKPIRNAEGILIRKDGRPDMRSVSSANNLRKVHAKKEAERAEAEGRTPTSARSLAPAHSNSLSDDGEGTQRTGTPGSGAADEDDEQDTQQRHQALMSKIFPHGIDSAGGRGLAGAYFPRNEEPTSVPDAYMKIEREDSDERRPGDRTNGNETSQMTDVVMREMSEAQAEDHAEHDVKVATVRGLDNGQVAQQDIRETQ